MHKAGTVFHSGIRFPRFLTFVLLALFVATSQANGRFQTAAAGCRSTGFAPLRGSLRAAPITFRCGWAGVPLSADKIIARQLAKAAFGWMGTARHLLGPSLCRFLHRWSSRIRQIAFPRRVLPTDVLLNRIFFFQRTTEVNVPLFNPTENRVLTSHFFKNFLIFFFAHWMDSKAALYPQFSAFAMS